MSPRLRSLTFTIFAAWTRWHRRLLRSALGTWVTETSLGMARQKALAVLLRGFASTRVDATTREEEVLPMGSVLRRILSSSLQQWRSVVALLSIYLSIVAIKMACF